MPTKKEVEKYMKKIKKEIAKKLGLTRMPTNIEILSFLSEKPASIITKPVRTISGVAPIAIMTSPAKCPHVKKGIGPCIMCPGGPDSVFGNVPQSYTGEEPAASRAIRNKFDPYLQVFNRLEHYVLLNQNFEKVEFIIMGGTFPARKKDYQERFIGYAFKALNDFSKIFYVGNKFDFVKFKEFFELPAHVKDAARVKRIIKKISLLKGRINLKAEQLKNEKARIRCVALCIETRPDYCKQKHINQMLALGTTRIELGVQTIYDEILKKINRGHSVKDSIKATQLAKDCFLKVGYHMMLGLPFSTLNKDIVAFKEIFENPEFRPDALKIYPCLVIKGTKLYQLYKDKKFLPVTKEQAIDAIIEIKKSIPKYCRILRIQRDIATQLIEAGVDASNLRQIVHQRMKELNIKCNCIRCREPFDKEISWQDVKFLAYEYEASKGTEIFITAEDTKNDILLGFCRLRIPYKPFRKEITSNSAGIRELHVYGKAASLTASNEKTIQHKGLGKKLLNKAEELAREKFDIKKLLVISGIGVREYYRNLGYKREGIYMVKKLS